MGFAKYFDRDVVALNKRLSRAATANFKEILAKHVICVEFDDQVLRSNEASCCLEMLVRIISRLYPKLKFIGHHDGDTSRIGEVADLARSINKEVEIARDDEPPTIVINLTPVATLSTDCLSLFVSSQGWLVSVSQEKVQKFGTSSNPFGGSVAACVVASILFQTVFKDQLDQKPIIDVSFSVLSFVNGHDTDLSLDAVQLDDVNLIGVGAIGSVTVWALSKLSSLTGKIRLIDHDRVQESNLHRYVVMTEADVGQSKVAIARNILFRDGLELEVVEELWGTFVHRKWDGECTARLAAVCIDSKDGRILIQGSLPKLIINAYTDESRFGISRHTDFNANVCLACLYIPEYQERGRLQTITEELNMKGSEKLIYQYMRADKLIDDQFLDLFARQNGLDATLLQEYKSKSLGDFYLHMVCGYQLMKIAGENRKAEFVDVPLSFQSAMAGILFALELVAESHGLTVKNPYTVSQWQVLEPIDENNPSHYQYIKNKSGTCICGDDEYRQVYSAKWAGA